MNATEAATAAQAGGATGTAASRRGSELLISASGSVPPDKLRLLRAILANACQQLRDELFGLTDVMFETQLQDVSVQPVLALGMQSAQWLVTLCSVKHHNTLSCIALDAAAANLCIEAMLGGGAVGRSTPGARQWTAIDHALVGQVASIVAAALQEAFAPSHDLVIGTSEIRPGDATEELALEERPVLAAQVTLQALGEAGTLCIVLPSSLAASLNSCPLMPTADDNEEEAAPQTPWAQELDAQLRAAEVECRAVMDGGEVTLAEVAAWQPGQVLPLRTTPEAPVRLECDGETLFHCALGQANGMFMLKLLHAANKVEEFAEAMMVPEGAHDNE